MSIFHPIFISKMHSINIISNNIFQFYNFVNLPFLIKYNTHARTQKKHFIKIMSSIHLNLFSIYTERTRIENGKLHVFEHRKFWSYETFLKLTISSLGLTNSRACRLIAWNAALGAYPGWCGVEGKDVETSVLPVTVNCFLLIDIV